MYTANFQEPVFSIEIQNIVGLSSNSNITWAVLCFDGSIGLSSLKKINKLIDTKPSFDYCDEYIDN